MGTCRAVGFQSGSYIFPSLTNFCTCVRSAFVCRRVPSHLDWPRGRDLQGVPVCLLYAWLCSFGLHPSDLSSWCVPPATWQVTFNPQGSKILTASSDKSARLWEVEAGDCLQVLHCLCYTTKIGMQKQCFVGDAVILRTHHALIDFPFLLAPFLFPGTRRAHRRDL